MNTIEQHKALLLNLIDKYLEGKTTTDENKDLIRYFESFQKERGWNETIGSKEDLKIKMLMRLQTALNNEESDGEKKIIKLNTKKNSYLKYAVAASIALLISFTYYYTTTNNTVVKTNTISNKNSTIKIGTDKATLTLDDGATIALEKGTGFKTTNAESNGEKIVYKKSSEKTTPEIAYNYLTIPRGGQFFVELADGTKVWLNSESQLKYPVTFIDGETRKVELLYGEAYFEVSPSTEHHGAAFIVQSQMQDIEVLGTEFNVKAYQGDTNTYTTLVEGKVAINYDGKKLNLIPNQQSNLNTNTKALTVATVDVYNEISWKDGVFSFRGKKLKDIVKVLSRWYDVEIVIVDKTLENITFKGVLGKNQKIEDILYIMKNTSAINEYEITEKTIRIK